MMLDMGFPYLAYGTPRKLPKAKNLQGRVVVLDIAFAAEVAGSSFESTTLPLIRGLGSRLAMWVDHHDHEQHANFASDPRFVLATKAEHGACPEMITPELVEKAGPVDTICCHIDFDGLCSAAKWIRGGKEPYEGADRDAHAIDTRLGKAGPVAVTIDRALRARPKDDALKGLVVKFLVDGAQDKGVFAAIGKAAAEVQALEEEARRLAIQYQIEGQIAYCDARVRKHKYDKTLLLLLGQEKATVSVVYDESTVTIAARFDSGIDLLRLFQLAGGMPTRISLPARDLEKVMVTLKDLKIVDRAVGVSSDS